MRSISVIAYDIAKEWGAKTNYAAKPYLSAMKGLENVNSNYGFDDARSIINYFLANASGFRGEKARELKAELKQHLKG